MMGGRGGARPQDLVAAWNEVLDVYEARLVAVRDAMAAGDLAAVPPFQPPSDLGTIPPSLTGRARQLLAASRELEQAILQAQKAVRSRLAQRPSTPPPRRASRLDVSV